MSYVFIDERLEDTITLGNVEMFTRVDTNAVRPSTRGNPKTCRCLKQDCTSNQPQNTSHSLGVSMTTGCHLAKDDPKPTQNFTREDHQFFQIGHDFFFL